MPFSVLYLSNHISLRTVLLKDTSWKGMYVVLTRGTRIYRVPSCKPVYRIGQSLGDHAS